MIWLTIRKFPCFIHISLFHSKGHWHWQRHKVIRKILEIKIRRQFSNTENAREEEEKEKRRRREANVLWSPCHLHWRSQQRVRIRVGLCSFLNEISRDSTKNSNFCFCFYNKVRRAPMLMTQKWLKPRRFDYQTFEEQKDKQNKNKKLVKIDTILKKGRNNVEKGRKKNLRVFGAKIDVLFGG